MSYFGQCPECRREPDFIHVGKSHFATCPDCKVGWYAGYNLITTHVRLDDVQLLQLYGHTDRERISAGNLARLKAEYREVEPIYSVGGTP